MGTKQYSVTREKSVSSIPFGPVNISVPVGMIPVYPPKWASGHTSTKICDVAVTLGGFAIIGAMYGELRRENDGDACVPVLRVSGKVFKPLNQAAKDSLDNHVDQALNQWSGWDYAYESARARLMEPLAVKQASAIKAMEKSVSTVNSNRYDARGLRLPTSAPSVQPAKAPSKAPKLVKRSRQTASVAAEALADAASDPQSNETV